MDWTAEQVHELTKDWPVEAKLRGAYYTPSDGGHICDREGLKMLVDTAVHGYVGCGLAWLAQRGSSLHSWDDLWKVRMPRGTTADARYTWTTNFATALEAVSAAVLAAKGGGT